jgi:hypothetical protein
MDISDSEQTGRRKPDLGIIAIQTRGFCENIWIPFQGSFYQILSPAAFVPVAGGRAGHRLRALRCLPCFGWRTPLDPPLALGRTPATRRAKTSMAVRPRGMGVMARRLFRCGHLGCRCSDLASRERVPVLLPHHHRRVQEARHGAALPQGLPLPPSGAGMPSTAAARTKRVADVFPCLFRASRTSTASSTAVWQPDHRGCHVHQARRQRGLLCFRASGRGARRQGWGSRAYQLRHHALLETHHLPCGLH